jgi:LacI family transcriptional regulator
MTQRTRRAVTITDVANRAEVSLGTASRALNNHPKVEIKLRQRVLNAAKELGYVHRSRPASGTLLEAMNPGVLTEPVKSGKINLLNPEKKIRHLAFCCRTGIAPDNSPDDNNYFSLVLHGAEAECRKRNLQLTYRLIEDDVKELEHARVMLNDSEVDALILVNFIDHELVRGLLELEKPTVLVDHFFPDLPLDVVMNDSYEGALQAVQYLLANGHRRIAFVNGLPHHTIQRRLDAYLRAQEIAGLAINPNWILPGDLTVRGGQLAGEEFLRRGLDCTAVFCANDSTAFGFMQVMAHNNVRIPQDISVMGFDDVAAASFIWPPLTTVEANASMLGQLAVHRLLERTNYPYLPVTRTLVHTELVIRSSVASLKT